MFWQVWKETKDRIWLILCYSSWTKPYQRIMLFCYVISGLNRVFHHKAGEIQVGMRASGNISSVFDIYMENPLQTFRDRRGNVLIFRWQNNKLKIFAIYDS